MTAVLALALSVSLAMQAVTPVQTAEAPQASPEEIALVQRYEGAQARVERYRTTGDLDALRSARRELSEWLVEHQTLYGTQAAAESIRTPVRDQLAQIDAVLAAAAPSPPPAAAPQRSPSSSAGRSMITAGAVLLPIGVVLAATVAAPLWYSRDLALERAEDSTFRVDQRDAMQRAETLHAGGWVAMGFSIALMGGGLALLTTGIVKRSTRHQARVVPTFTPRFVGVSTSVRF